MKRDYFETLCAIAFNCSLLAARINKKVTGERLPTADQKPTFLKSSFPEMLLSDFLPPLEREDLFLLCESLKELHRNLILLDNRLSLFEKELDVKKFLLPSDRLCDCCGIIYDAIVRMSQNRRPTFFDNLKTAERVANEELHVSRVFCESRIYDSFEKCFESVKDARKVLILTVLKNF